MTRAPVSVGQLTSYIADLFRYDDLLGDIWVEGEVSSLSAARSGHQYFKLTDGSTLLNCVLFQQKLRLQRYLPEIGERFILHGSVGVYEAAGSYQLYVDVVQPAGLGMLALEFARLRQRLHEEGLFEPSRKRPLPRYPVAIGVVTSAEGAVWQDIQHVVARRYRAVELVLCHAQVQGAAAPASIIAAIQRLSLGRKCDLIIVARGGGSAEDLSAFNDEGVVRAIFAAPVPVVSAVGHESDWTLADEVADMRAPTPSAAAEMCTPLVDDLLQVISRRHNALFATVLGQFDTHWQQQREMRRRIEIASPQTLVTQYNRAIQEMQQRAQFRSMERHRLARDAATSRRQRLSMKRHTIVQPKQIDWATGNARLETLDPLATLGRGYAVLEARNGKRIRSSRDVLPADQFVAQLVDGNIDAQVLGVPGPGVQRS